MRKLFSLLGVFVLASGMAFGQSACLQDQYGNQYNFIVDKTNNYVYGSVTPGPTQCVNTLWPLTGSFVTSTSGIALELTAANPKGSSDERCVPMYTLKGIMPNFDWFYASGVSIPPQPGTWVTCGSPASDKATGRGARK
jgi:hypothetical protein